MTVWKRKIFWSSCLWDTQSTFLFNLRRFPWHNLQDPVSSWFLQTKKKKKKLPMFQLVQADAIVYFVFSLNSHHFDQHHFQQSPTVFTLSSIFLSYKGLFTYGGGGFWARPLDAKSRERERAETEYRQSNLIYKKKKTKKGGKVKPFWVIRWILTNLTPGDVREYLWVSRSNTTSCRGREGAQAWFVSFCWLTKFYYFSLL